MCITHNIFLVLMKKITKYLIDTGSLLLYNDDLKLFTKWGQDHQKCEVHKDEVASALNN